MEQPLSPSLDGDREDLLAGAVVRRNGAPRPRAPSRAPVPSDRSRDDGALAALLDRALDVPGARETAAPFLAQLVPRQYSVRAVLLYGSCLWSSVRGSNSQPDFIVIVDSLRAFHGRVGPALLGAVLPPTVYRLRLGTAYAKVSIATVAQLRSQCAAGARDLHLAGRLSKRVALVWARDDQARRLIVAAQLAALRMLAPLALSRFDGRVGLDDFVQALLRLSYESEIRIVEPNKVAALFAAEYEHYRELARTLLLALGARPDGDNSELLVPPRLAASRAHVARRLRRSRRRALWRFPKYLVTYDGWLDYLLKKLARAGTPVTLTYRQRRHPLVFAIPVLWQLAISKRLA